MVSVEKQKRLSYTNEFKLMVVTKAEEVGNREAGRIFEVDEKCVRQWRANLEHIRQMDKWKRTNRHGTPWWISLEDNLHRWIWAQRQSGEQVSMLMIRRKAETMAKEMNLVNFKGGPKWCYRFMRRRRIPLPKEALLDDIERNCSNINSVNHCPVPSVGSPKSFPQILDSGMHISQGFHNGVAITGDFLLEPVVAVKTEVTETEEDCYLSPVQDPEIQLWNEDPERMPLHPVCGNKTAEEEEILPTVKNTYSAVTVKNHRDVSHSCREQHSPQQEEMFSCATINGYLSNPTEIAVSCELTKVNSVSSAVTSDCNPVTQENVFKHYLSDDVDLKKFPLGWAPLFLPHKLQVFRIKDEAILMCVEVTGNGQILLKVLNGKVPETHPVSSAVLRYYTVNSFVDLVDLLRKLDEWLVCSGVSEKRLVNFYQRSGEPVCKLFPLLSSLYSMECELLFPAERKVSICKMCKVLCEKLTTDFTSSREH